MKTLQFNIPVIQGQSITVQEDISESFYPHLHRHQEAQLMWITKGKGVLLVDETLHPFKENDIFFIGAHQAHVFKSISEDKAGDAASSISIFFDPGGRLKQLFMLGEFQSLEQFLRQDSKGFKIPELDFEVVSNRIMLLKQSEKIEKMMHFFYLLRTLSQISKKTDPLCPEYMESAICTTGKNKRIEEVCHYINTYFRHGLTLESVAERAHLSPQAFCRYFKKHCGMTLVGYLNRIRINEVCHQLGRDHLHLENISFIAYNCGFNSITNFNRVFKQIIGCTPKEYILRYDQRYTENSIVSYV
ncbi:MAG: AraC family transcriptional regulator [Sphingobacterium sp.]|jgi:AraC-like DNA-binding protein|uniref:AraC family transcriptional regulator n=1 Tax=Sphingobacterium sp. TaxID=341027 RepID=UPI00282B130C|nr:AraC family transcriptional regulator [Sphingobacterium sp.]MDR0266449.1 AraC family transcriptional regulator [Sphingobacterium sp.]